MVSPSLSSTNCSKCETSERNVLRFRAAKRAIFEGSRIFVQRDSRDGARARALQDGRKS